MLKLYINGKDTELKLSTFKGGEEFLESTKQIMTGDTLGVYAYVRSSVDLMRLMSLLELCQESGNGVYLHLPYLPYARQDRKMNSGQANQANMMCRLLNSFGCITEIRIDDPHSKAAYQNLDKVQVCSQEKLLCGEFRQKFSFIREADVILAPDKGAIDRCKKVADMFNLPLTHCHKKRNLDTGEIIETQILGDTSGKNIVIVDDIIDGGRTFINIAEKITDAKSLQLVCTHGIFSYGKDVLLKHFSRVEAVYDWTTF